MTRTRLLVLGGLLVLVLGLLLSGLSGIEFRGGTRGRGPARAPLGAVGGRGAFAAPEWILDVIVILFFVVAAVQVAFVLLAQRDRRGLLRRLAMIALTLLVLFLLAEYGPREPPKVEGPSGDVAVPALPGLTEGEAREESERARAPGWAVYLVAGAVGVGLAWWVAGRLMSRPPSQAEEIRDAAHAASADLARGLPVADVVIRCWLRMVEILSRQARGADAPAVTPREFAQGLVRLGFREEAVWELTTLFEEVRYGRKESEPRRAAALAALAAIERAYG